MISRIDKLEFSCTEHSLLYRALFQETYNFVDPANRSHPTRGCLDAICLGKKLQSFELPTQDSPKPEVNRFCVLMHIGTDRFTLYKFPPPPPQ